MKFYGKSTIILNQPGVLKITPQTLDDLFFLHDKLLFPGHIISAATSRKINSATNSSAKSKPIRVSIDLELKITALDPVDQTTSVIRIKGKSTITTKGIEAGSCHTVELELGREFSLKMKSWDRKSIQAINNPPEPLTVLGERAAAMKIGEFMDVFAMKSDRVCYGLKSVEKAKEMNAIERLMVCDDLLKGAERKKYVEMVDSVKEASGEVLVFPAKHEKMKELTGITAILRFPLFEDDDNNP